MSDTVQVGINQAARLTGKNKSVIWRDTKAGKLSSNLDGKGKTVYNLAELERVYGTLRDPNAETVTHAVVRNPLQPDFEREVAEMRLQFLQKELDLVREQLFELRTDRDQWREQAQTALRALPRPNQVNDGDGSSHQSRGFWPFRKLSNA